MTSTGSGLLHQLATLGVELEIPSIVATKQQETIAQEGLIFAQQIHSWQVQLTSLHTSTRSIVQHLFNHLKRNNSLSGWDAWLASMLEMSLTESEATTPHFVFRNRLEPDSITTAQLLSVALVLVRQGLLSSTALVMGWILIRESSALAESRELAEELCAAVIQMFLEGCSPKCNENASVSSSDWKHLVGICINLKDLSKCMAGADQYSFDRQAKSLFELAYELKDAQESATVENDSAFSNELWVVDAVRRIKAGDYAVGYSQLSELASALQNVDLSNGDQAALHQLRINAFTQSVPDLPALTLVDCKSLPRSGHHHLKRLLQESHQGSFSHCEKYQEPGCCKTSPCRADAYWSYARDHGRDHLRLVKSHDFQLDDPVFQTMPGWMRLIQIRQPRHLLISWLELHHIQLNQEMLYHNGVPSSRIYLYHEKALLSSAWKLIDESGIILTIAEAKEWLKSKELYIIGFLEKWLPCCNPFSDLAKSPSMYGNYVIRYEDLGQYESTLRGLGRRRDIPSSEFTRIEFSPRHDNILERESNKISSLLETTYPCVAVAERRILDQTADYQRLMRYEPLPSSEMKL